MQDKIKLAAVAAASVLLTLAAGSAAMAARDHGLGPLGHVDLNNDGKITKAEWLTAATTRFAAIDRNGDGVLIVGEVPAPPAGPPHGRHHPRPDWDEDDAPPPPPAVAPVTDQPQTSSGNTAAAS